MPRHWWIVLFFRCQICGTFVLYLFTGALLYCGYLAFLHHSSFNSWSWFILFEVLVLISMAFLVILSYALELQRELCCCIGRALSWTFESFPSGRRALESRSCCWLRNVCVSSVSWILSFCSLLNASMCSAFSGIEILLFYVSLTRGNSIRTSLASRCRFSLALRLWHEHYF